MSLQHWKFQRISALIMIPVIIISVSYLINITSLTYDELILDLGSTSVKIIGSFLSVLYFTIAVWVLRS